MSGTVERLQSLTTAQPPRSPLLCLALCLLGLASCSQRPVAHAAIEQYLHAEDFYVRGQIEAAEAMFASISDHYPNFYQTRFMQGKSLYLLNRAPEAERVFADLAHRFPQYYEARIWLARVEIDRGEDPAADKQLSQLLSWDSQDPRLLYLMALVKNSEKKPQEAITYLKEAAAYGDELAQDHIELGRLYFGFGLQDLARTELQQALSLLPEGSPLAAPVQELLAKLPKKKE